MSPLWTLFGLAALFEAAHSAGFYTVIGPRILRPNSEYHAAITVQDVSESTTVVVEVGGKQDSGGNFKNSQYVAVEPFVTRIVRLEVGDIGPGSYNLTVNGNGGLSFFNSTELTYVHKSYSVFVQTDKAIYKPGHKVQFRAIVLNSHLKPAVTGSFDVHITDGDGNRVKQWTRVLTSRGVFSEEFQLSSSPVLGDWTISVNVLDQYFNKTFQVAEYVLPKFEVTLDVPNHASFKDSKIPVIVRAKYTYGKPVKGEATITAYPSYFSDVIQPIFQPPVRKVIPIDGKAATEIDVVKELSLTDEFERVVQFDVTVEEALTGRRQNSTSKTVLHKHPYKLDLIRTSEYFKPGLKYTAYIKVTHNDGTPVLDKTNPVKVRYGYSYVSEEYNESLHTINNGLVELQYYPPASNVSTLGIEAEYRGVNEWFSSISAAVSPSNSFIQAQLKTENPKVNNDIEIEVNSTAPLKYLSYQVIGRGDVIVANTVRAQPGSSTAAWRFLATSAMAPTAHLIVQYVREDGEVVADSLDIDIQGALQNFVSLDVSPSEVQPGANVEMKLEAKPNSVIGLMGIDQSVLLLKSGNDILKDDILNELTSYDSGSHMKYNMYFRSLRDKRSLFWSPGSFTAQEAFEKSGAIILTNAYVHEHKPWLGSNAGVQRARNRDPNRPSPSPGSRVLKPDLGPPVIYRPVTRPPLAGPYAFSRIPTPVWNRPRVFLLTDPAETWLFANLSTGFDGKTSIRKQVPDTITSWVISAFSVDPLYGLGLLEEPRKVKVFRPFFLSIDLPYSVTRGETISIPVVVFNYMNKEVAAEVTLENAGQFEFTDFTNDVYDAPKLELFRKKKLTIPPNSGGATSFLITPKELGYISIKVSAKSSIAGDIVDKKLLVKPEGDSQLMNHALFVDLRGKNQWTTNFTLKIPENIVPDSELIEVGAVGDILGPSILNLGNLIKMPFGCGEQNMLNFVPNIVVLDYLKSSNQLTPATESKLLRFLETGYQQELTYKREDGSFSAFGKADPSGSTWLTAFVARSFRQATKYISIDENIIYDSLQWLASNQAANGSFPEVGQVSHKDMQGGSSQGLALTAYTLVSFLENRSATSRFRNVINKAIDYIVRNADGLNDTYAIAICAYALQLHQHPTMSVVFNLLESKAQTENHMKWWRRAPRESDRRNPHLSNPNSVDIEMTSYAMLTYLNNGLTEDCFPIMKWLISQQNADGGFASTQDTVMALTALARLAEKISSSSNDITISFSYGKGVSTDIRVTNDNSMVLQKHEIPRKVREIEIKATGRGFAVAQISYRFNVNVTGAWPLFTLDPQVDKNSDSNHLQLSVCSGFVGSKESNESNMAVMEVSLPSGFTVDPDSLPSLQLSQNVKRVETKEGDTVVVLYFDKMTLKEYCPTISAFRTHKVAKQRPVPVKIYDYYDQTRSARMFYEARAATVCEICDDGNCLDCPGVKAGSQKDTDEGGAASTYQISLSLLLAPVSLLLFHRD